MLPNTSTRRRCPLAIPITKPCFGPEEFEAIRRPLESGWLVQGPYVAEFERKFAAFTETRHAIASSSCTTALHLAVVALDLKPGDEVIVPAFTWVATPNAVEYAGATPVFCDIDLATFNIDVGQIESIVSPRTVGIVPVHLFGLCADLRPILQLAQTHGLWVVEDAACALGARYQGRPAGTFGHLGCFSFHPRKSITTGEGGMVTTDRDDLAARVEALRDHGAVPADPGQQENRPPFALPEFPYLGYNYRMTDLQGALGSVQMDRAPWLLAQRLNRARRYDAMLASVPWLQTPTTPEGYGHGFQSYVCLLEPERIAPQNVERLRARRDRLMTHLGAAGIATRPGTHAPVLLRYYVDKYKFRPEQFPCASAADGISLALPLYAQMTDAEQDTVCDALVRAHAALGSW
jgi:perosamine synthetase